MVGVFVTAPMVGEIKCATWSRGEGWIIRKWKQKGVLTFDGKAPPPLLLRNLSKPDIIGLSEEVLLQLNSKSEVGFLDSTSLYSLMLFFAGNGLFPQAQALWDHQLVNSSSLPTIETVAKLFDVLSQRGHFNQVSEILAQLSSRQG
ncbi:hypothetical protein L484_008218 [Morus notabilis]|uniref:Pentatricopeptide repeat-containing protein n=1 Tax=Morus notabilis TaxID=981085 RepID=W9RVG6_9ROSA|nr:hypothetical protein L484_008218 [Morus notabilis]